MGATERVSATGAKFVDDLLTPAKWAAATISYGFASSASTYGAGYGLGEANDSFSGFDASQKSAARAAFDAWSDVAGISFTETSADGAEIRLANSGKPSTAWAYGPSTAGTGGDVWIGDARFNDNPELGKYAYMTIMHEIGHALGLSHPHDAKMSGAASVEAELLAAEGLCPCCAGGLHDAAAGQGTPSAAQAALSAIDSMAYSIMSYRSYAGANIGGGYTNESNSYAQGPMMRDIAAVQALYGANYNTRSGNTVYRWSETTGEKSINGVGQGAPSANKVFETIWDGGGRDTLELSNYKADLKIDLSAGGWSDFGGRQLADLGAGKTAPGNVALAQLVDGDTRALIENAVGGSGNDTISGNEAANLLMGGAGDDRLEGVAGNNILVGGYLGNELDLVSINVRDMISVDIAPIKADGNDTLIGGAGNDVFIPGAGTNSVTGGAGSDTLVLDFAFEALEITGDAKTTLTISYDGGSVKATGIEFLATNDGIYSLLGQPVTAASGEFLEDIMLLYKAAFGRELDADGEAYWSGVIDSSDDMLHMAGSLLYSPEFGQRFGEVETLGNADYVNQLYNNVLGREGEAGGLDYWIGRLEDGADRAHVLLAFAQSDENRQNVSLATTASEPLGKETEIVSVSHAQWSEVWG
ncbi:hypothetical protein GCM10007989_30850 [Devosia pacifica]|uniref:Peptidase metallopeptidase domain-containing protein n=1 Tax=Devosia pacifica TaxID=1335967 RepID=A0A918VWX2_9HYPH|nr:DUF4214 domain-containing protein [Devosia pacifica]GHA32576.1 hypothetical protein GCM10007989_30850 [Devosia pacifica]